MRFIRVRREILFLLGALVLLGLGFAGLRYMRPQVLTVAVGPREGATVGLFKAFADALAANDKDIRLEVLPFDDVRSSAAALAHGAADLAVIRPDVDLPENALTLAILRNQAMIIAAPVEHGIHNFEDLAFKRLGLVEHHEADFSLLQTLGNYYDLTMRLGEQPGRSASGVVRVVRLQQSEIAAAFAAHRIDAVATIMVPTRPEALQIVRIVQAAARDGHISFVDVPDDDAITARFPLLQSVTIPSGIFGGHPRLPREDVKTVGASYRLVSRATLDRVTAGTVTQDLFELRGFLAARSAAADDLAAPDYDTTAIATSARLPLHPGAIDYFERDQQSFLDRYEDLGYVVASLLGGLGSASAWLYHRVMRNRRQRIDDVLDRLASINAEVRLAQDGPSLSLLIHEIDDLALEIVHAARHDEAAMQTMAALSLAVQTARSAVTARWHQLDQTGRTDVGVAA